MLSGIISIGLCTVYSAACISLGLLLLRWIIRDPEARCRSAGMVEVATAFLLGQGVLANIWLLLALFALFSPPIVVGLLVLSLLAGAPAAWPVARDVAGRLRPLQVDFRAASPWYKTIIGLVGVYLLVQAVGAIGLPLSIDPAAFYLALAKNIAASHRIVPLPGYELFTQIGILAEMHYAALLLLGNLGAAKLIVWFVSVTAAIMMVAIARTIGLGRYGQTLALVALLTSTSFTLVMTDGKTDLLAAALGLAAYYWALQAGRPGERSAVALAGLFLGLAIVAKISYLVALAPGIGLLVLWRRWMASERPWSWPAVRSTSVAMLILGGTLFLTFLPQVIKNTMLFNQPLAPFIVSNSTSQWLDQQWFSPEVTRRILLTYPLALTLGQYSTQYGNLSPLLLAFLPLAFLLPRPRPFLSSPLVQITIVAVIGIVAWVILRPAVFALRYLLAPLLLLSLLPIRGAEYTYRLEAPVRRISWGISTFTLVVLLLTTIQATKQVGDTISMIGETECETTGSSCRVLEVVNQDAQPGERLYLASYYRYWLRPDLLQCSAQPEDRQGLGADTPEERWAALYQRGFRYLVIDRGTHSLLLERYDPKRMPPWLTLVPLYSEGNYAAFRLDSSDPSHQPELVCRQVHPPAWEVVPR